MRRAIPLTLILLLAILPARAQVVSVEVVDYGIYEVVVVGHVAAPGDIALQRNVLSDIRVEERTRRVAAMPGRSFGYRYRISAPAGTPLILRTVFPQLTNPETGLSATTQDRLIHTNGDGRVRFDGYRFDHGWEMAEGDWVFQILHDGLVVSEQRFRVVILLN